MLLTHRHRALAALSATLLGTAILAGCATRPIDDQEAVAAYEEANDPLEPMNRAIFSFNQFADGILIKPLAIMYRMLVPPEVRSGLHNFLENLRAPVHLANDLMQGETDRAFITFQRFIINSTAGGAGFVDVAEDFGIEGHREDFGQTIAVWGSGEGPYLMLPLLGPSNVRDTTGLVVDSFLDPLVYFVPNEALIARTLVRGIDEREGVLDTLDEIERTSLDFYATLRSLYRQHREDVIRNGAPSEVLPVPAISIQDFEKIEDDQDAKFTLN
jgi:phospholipid-binding lipoprotein MlaA